MDDTNTNTSSSSSSFFSSNSKSSLDTEMANSTEKAKRPLTSWQLNNKNKNKNNNFWLIASLVFLKFVSFFWLIKFVSSKYFLSKRPFEKPIEPFNSPNVKDVKSGFDLLTLQLPKAPQIETEFSEAQFGKTEFGKTKFGQPEKWLKLNGIEPANGVSESEIESLQTVKISSSLLAPASTGFFHLVETPLGKKYALKFFRNNENGLQKCISNELQTRSLLCKKNKKPLHQIQQEFGVSLPIATARVPDSFLELLKNQFKNKIKNTTSYLNNNLNRYYNRNNSSDSFFGKIYDMIKHKPKILDRLLNKVLRAITSNNGNDLNEDLNKDLNDEFDDELDLSNHVHVYELMRTNAEKLMFHEDDELTPIKLDEEAKLSLARQITASIFKLHSEGIVLNSLSLRNILVDETGSVRISGFSFATPAGQTVHTENLSAMYMEPERVIETMWSASRTVISDPAVDLYSLGLVLAEIFNQQNLSQRGFSGMAVEEFVAENLDKPGFREIDVYAKDSKIPESWRAFIHDLLEMKRENRKTSSQLYNKYGYDLFEV